jgi:hypothetical protein
MHFQSPDSSAAHFRQTTAGNMRVPFIGHLARALDGEGNDKGRHHLQYACLLLDLERMQLTAQLF